MICAPEMDKIMKSSLLFMDVLVYFRPQQLYKVVPIKDIRNLYVTFPIPDLQKYYKSNPGHYLGHLIGHEGPGSLLSELKAKGKSFEGKELKSNLLHNFLKLSYVSLKIGICMLNLKPPNI